MVSSCSSRSQKLLKVSLGGFSKTIIILEDFLTIFDFFPKHILFFDNIFLCNYLLWRYSFLSQPFVQLRYIGVCFFSALPSAYFKWANGWELCTFIVDSGAQLYDWQELTGFVAFSILLQKFWKYFENTFFSWIVRNFY